MIRQLTRNTTLLLVEDTNKRAPNDKNTSINKLFEAIARIVPQQRPTTSAILKPTTTNTKKFDGIKPKSENLEISENLFHTMIRIQPEITEARKNNNFRAHLRKKALRTFRKLNATNKKTLENAFIVFR